jgi:cell division protein FtsQ
VATKQRGRQPRARADAVALPRTASRRRGRARVWSRVAPSPRSLLVGLALASLGVGGYLFARETSAFSIRTVDVTGAPAPVAAQVRRALEPLVGSSLVGLDGGRVAARVDALPTVVSASYDRAFPHTLHVSIVPERVVAVLRRGKQAWLVSARGRVVEPVARVAQPGLPRIWLPAATDISVGSFLDPEQGGDAARALSFTSRFPQRIEAAGLTAGSLVFHLRSGIDLRLGDPAQMPLKLAVARRALRRLPAGSTYLDVGLPGRPVAGDEAASVAQTTGTDTTAVTNPQVSTGG